MEIIIKEISSPLKSKYSDFEGIYFFGSRASGSHEEDSDYDLLFAFGREIDWKFEKEITAVIYDFMLEYDVIIDCKIYSHSEILDPVTPFRENVKKEGIFYGS
ncbi:MAG: nucleotidyltransferase domain-containing protein [Ignavibacteria bacterium]|nr:nucleotidyltransferase domain-containing protein [Ignavibacteria bacterium]